MSRPSYKELWLYEHKDRDEQLQWIRDAVDGNAKFRNSEPPYSEEEELARKIMQMHARIAELEAERRWRVVADGELPELGKEVIFYDSIMKRRLKGCLRKNGGVEWLSDEGYTFSSRDGRYSWITHWMYAPQPPEVQNV